MTSVAFQLGAIVAIPLPSGMFAFAKVFQSPTLGIYDLVCNEIPELSTIIKIPFSFFQACNDEAIKTGEWKIIGNEPFKDIDESWPPPQATMYVREKNEWTMWNTPHIDYKGQVIKSTLDQVKGMDIMSVCHRPELLIKIIIDRVINGNHEPYKVRST